jgi:hypothetical protein
MATKSVAKIVRNVVGKEATIYNDKLKNGVRSIKLDMWAHNNSCTYELVNRSALTKQAGKALEAASYKVQVKTTRGGSTRLHVS